MPRGTVGGAAFGRVIRMTPDDFRARPRPRSFFSLPAPLRVVPGLARKSPDILLVGAGGVTNPPVSQAIQPVEPRKQINMNTTDTTTTTTTEAKPKAKRSKRTNWFRQGVSQAVLDHLDKLDAAGAAELASSLTATTPTVAAEYDLPQARQATAEADIHQAIHGTPPPCHAEASEQRRTPVCRRIYTAPADGRPAIDHELRQANRQLPAKTILDTLKTEMPEAYCAAQLIGSWVWVSFPSKQPPTVTARLAQLGFHWNSKRQAWQHPGGVKSTGSKTSDPREKYPTSRPADQAVA